MTVYEEIQAAIDYAWATEDPQVKLNQVALIGDIHKPTPEELIFCIYSKIFAETT